MTVVPNGWADATVGDVCVGVLKTDPRTRLDTPFIYVDISGVDGEAGQIASTQELVGRDAPSRARQLLAKDDVVVSTVRTYMQKSALVPSALAGLSGLSAGPGLGGFQDFFETGL